MRVSKLFIFIFILSVFILQYSIYLISSILFDRIIKVISFVLLLVLLRNYKLSSHRVLILFIYSALLGAALFGAIISLDFVGIYQWFKFILVFSILPIILLKFPSGTKPPDMLLKMPLFWGSLFSIQSILLFVIIIFNIPIESTIAMLERLDNMREVSYGIFGYANAIQTTAGGSILRAQGWFVEPSILSAFLLYPTFVSFGYYLSTRKIRYLLICLLCASGMIITFSFAGFIASIASILVLFLIRPIGKKTYKRTAVTYIMPFVVIVIFLFSAQFFLSMSHDLYRNTQEQTLFTKVFARDPSTQKLVREVARMEETTSLLEQHPFGIGLGFTLGESEANTANTPNAFLYWAVAGGLPAIIILIFIYFRLFYSYCLPLLLSKYSPYRYIGASFIGVTVQGLSYGNWMVPFYLFNIAVMILCADEIRRDKYLQNQQSQSLADNI